MSTPTILDLMFPLTPFINSLSSGDQRGGAGFSQMSYVVNMILVILAGYLAWNCSALETPAMRVFYTVLACLFSGFYLLYYLVYRVLMKNPCY